MPEPTGLSAERLDAIRARCEAATYGPWVVERTPQEWNDLGRERFGDRPEVTPTERVEIMTGWKHGQAGDYIPIIWQATSPYYTVERFLHFDAGDAEFIAHARDDVPDLLAAYEALLAAVSAYIVKAEQEMAEFDPSDDERDRLMPEYEALRAAVAAGREGEGA
jgi:hypothetical protein